MLLTTKVGLKPPPRRYWRVGFYCPRMQRKSWPPPPTWRCSNNSCDRIQVNRERAYGCSLFDNVCKWHEAGVRASTRVRQVIEVLRTSVRMPTLANHPSGRSVLRNDGLLSLGPVQERGVNGRLLGHTLPLAAKAGKGGRVLVGIVVVAE